MRVGVAGAGRWGKNIVRVLDELCGPVELYDPAQDGHFASFQDLAEACSHVVIAAPPELHAPLIFQAIASGVRLVFVEKPLATTSAEARAIGEYASSNGVKVAVGHALVTEASGFRPFYAGTTQRVEVFRHGGIPGHHVDAWWDLGPHDVAACIAILGRPERWKVVKGSDWYHARLFWYEADAYLTGIRGDGPKRWSFNIDGDKWSPYREPVEPLRQELQWWLDGGENLADAIAVVEVLEGA